MSDHGWMLIVTGVAVTGGVIAAITVPPIINGSYNFWVGELQKVLGIVKKEDNLEEDDKKALVKWKNTINGETEMKKMEK